MSVSDASGTIHLTDLLDAYAFGFVATGANTRLTFADSSAGTVDNDAMLDNVSVTAGPLPSAAWLLLSGCVLLLRKRIAGKARLSVGPGEVMSYEIRNASESDTAAILVSNRTAFGAG